MKTQTRTSKKQQRSFVPIASFEYESFEIPLRRVRNHQALPIGAVFRSLNVDPRVSQFKTMVAPIDKVQAQRIFLPSPSPQEPGGMRLRLVARPIEQPATVPSDDYTYDDPMIKEAQEPQKQLSVSQLK